MHKVVKNYYGNVLQSSADLQTNACCTDDELSPVFKSILSNIHEEVLLRYYGCGLVTPEMLAGCHVLDLGCGAGRDCYALAQLVGELGSVTGVDMTDEQLAVATKYIDYHREKFGYKHSNTKFVKGYIERLDALNIPDNSVDVVVSNCVINLSTDKKAVLSEVYRILKSGGEMYFSDVYADKRVPEHLKNDAELYGECLSGALYWRDFEHLAKAAGFLTPQLVSSRAITIDNEALANKLGDVRFTSATYRLFKASELEPSAEDYGQKVRYLGTIQGHESQWAFDQTTVFVKNEALAICSNTWRILAQSRFAEHFEFMGSLDKHFGPFNAEAKAFDFVGHTVEPTSCCLPKATEKKSCC